jgi:hypothetical protein
VRRSAPLRFPPHTRIGQFTKQRLISYPVPGLGVTLGTAIMKKVRSQKRSCGLLRPKGARFGPAVVSTAASEHPWVKGNERWACLWPIPRQPGITDILAHDRILTAAGAGNSLEGGQIAPRIDWTDSGTIRPCCQGPKVNWPPIKPPQRAEARGQDSQEDPKSAAID